MSALYIRDQPHDSIHTAKAATDIAQNNKVADREVKKGQGFLSELLQNGTLVRRAMSINGNTKYTEIDIVESRMTIHD